MEYYFECQENYVKDIDNEAIVFNIASGRSFVLNETTKYIVNNINDYTLDEIIKRLCENYEIAYEVAYRDCMKVMGDLLKYNIIKER